MMKPEIKRRYIRQISYDLIGNEGQTKILNSSVFIIGCGALGSMVAMQLAGAGVGNIGVADFDLIEQSNLQRQFFFKNEECGLKKANILEKRIKELNPDITVQVLDKFITESNASQIFKQYDVIIDATDNPASKFMVDRVCSNLEKPCVIGGVTEFSGQLFTLKPHNKTRFYEIFPDPEAAGVLPCSLSGVMGPAAAFCASYQAAETLKILTGIGETLSGRIFTFNLLSNKFNILDID